MNTQNYHGDSYIGISNKKKEERKKFVYTVWWTQALQFCCSPTIDSVEKNLSFVSARNKATIEYISERQSSSYELVFRVELDQNPYSKMISDFILNPLNESPTMSSKQQTQKCWV